MKSKIEKELRDWFNYLVSRYRWLSIKFEYSDARSVFLVSFSPTDKISECEPFIKESAEFEDLMNARYGNSSPLFCDDEKYFSLSPNAEVITIETVNMDKKKMELTPEYLCERINALSTYNAKLKELKENPGEYVVYLDFLDESEGYTSLTLDFNNKEGGVQMLRYIWLTQKYAFRQSLLNLRLEMMSKNSACR